MAWCSACAEAYDETDLDSVAEHLHYAPAPPPLGKPRRDLLDDYLEDELRREKVSLSSETRAVVLRILRRITAMLDGETPDSTRL